MVFVFFKTKSWQLVYPNSVAERYFFLLIIALHLLSLPGISHAGAWLSEPDGAEIIIKVARKKQATNSAFQTSPSTQIEFFGQFAINKDWSMSLNRLNRASNEEASYGAGQKFNIDFTTRTSLLNTGLLPPLTMKIIKKLSSQRVTREKSATIGLGYSMLREFPNTDYSDLVRITTAIGDKMTIGVTSFLGQVSVSQMFDGEFAISDTRALVQIERSNFTIGYEYGIYVARDGNVISEDLTFLDLPLPKLPARLRITRSIKQEPLFNARYDMFGVWLRLPFNLKKNTKRQVNRERRDQDHVPHRLIQQ